MAISRNILLSVLGSVLGLLLFPAAAFAATMAVSPAQAAVNAGDIVTVKLVVDTQGVAINNAEAVLNFSPDMLEAVSVDKTGSIFSLWIQNPSFSNTDGDVTFNGALPSPGYNGPNGTLLTVTFRAKHSGTATLSLSNASVLANDGLGTEVLKSTSDGTVNIGASAAAPAATTQPAAPAAAPAQPVTPAGQVPAAPVVASSDMPDADAWYANANPKFSWGLPADVTAVEVLVDHSPSSDPTVTYTPPIAEKTITDLTDGIWYLHVRFKNATGWSDTTDRAIKIDLSKPELSALASVPGDGSVSLSMRSSDDESGIDDYRIYVDGTSEAEVLVSGDSSLESNYVLKNAPSGSRTVTVRAYDKAGNYAEKDLPVTITGSSPIAGTSSGSAFALFALLAVLVFWVWYRFSKGLRLVQNDLQQTKKGDSLLEKQVAKFGDKLKEIVASTKTDLRQVKILVTATEKQQSKLEEALSSRIEDVQESVEKTIHQVQNAAADKEKQLEKRDDALETRIVALATVAEKNMQQLRTAIDKNLQDLRSADAEKGKRHSKLEQSIAARIDDVHASVEAQIDDIETTVEAKIKTLNASIEKNLQHLKETASGKEKDITKAAEKLEVKLKEVNASVEKSLAQLKTSDAKNVAQLRAISDKQLAKVEEQINAKLKELTSTVDKSIEQLNQSDVEKAQELAKIEERLVSSVAKAADLTKLEERVGKKLDERTKQLQASETAMDKRLEKIEERLGSKVAGATASISKEIQQVKKDLQQVRKGGGADEKKLAALESKIRELTVSLEKSLDQVAAANAAKAGELAKMESDLDSRLKAFTNLVEKNLTQLRASDAEKSQQLARTEELIRNMGREYQKLADAERQSRATLSRIGRLFK